MPRGIHMKGRKLPLETRMRMSNAKKGTTGENNNSWKGDSVGYHARHRRIERVLGKPGECENCGTTESKKFEWANLSGEYLSEVSDWARLCHQCHYLIDGIYQNLVWYKPVKVKE